jgi:hypothetical protein
MQFELQLPDKLQTQVPRAYDAEVDDVRSILIDVCKLASQDGCFVVSGFGQDRWPVDVRTDLVVLLEQLPEALIAIESGAPFAIDFYEQGVRRRISFSPADDGYVAECLSFGKWQPSPAVELIDRPALLRILTAVLDEFMRFMKGRLPDLIRHPWVQSWLEGSCNYLL